MAVTPMVMNMLWFFSVSCSYRHEKTHSHISAVDQPDSPARLISHTAASHSRGQDRPRSAVQRPRSESEQPVRPGSLAEERKRSKYKHHYESEDLKISQKLHLAGGQRLQLFCCPVDANWVCVKTLNQQ